jgi:nicotinate-nucleotide adenylyltransferase
MRIGILGGTFDPVHLGHLAVAEEARRLLVLDEIIFLPAGQPYFKDISAISPAEDRLKMLEMAVAGQPFYKISRLELDRSGPSYAVDSVEQIRKLYQPGGEIFFIMGWDSLMNLPLWHEAERLISLCRIAAAPRPGYSSPDVGSLEGKLPGISRQTVVMSRPMMDISATDIRCRARQGLPLEGLVPSAVAAYIRERGLYRIET